MTKAEIMKKHNLLNKVLIKMEAIPKKTGKS